LRFAFSDEFRELPEQLKVIFLAHTDTHRMEIDNVKPDMRQYVQIDKLYPLMTRSEQMQVLSEMGVNPDAEGEVAGLPDASKTMQAHQHLKDTEAREANKAMQIQNEKTKIFLDATAKADEHDLQIKEQKNALRSKEKGTGI
jgi:hypothetical protein